MVTYYCYECARNDGHISPVDPSILVDPKYQLEKFVKHTAPTGSYSGANSVFGSPDWHLYKDYMVTTAASGCLEIDDQGRKNLIFFAGEETGVTFDGGVFSTSCSGVKLVCGENSAKVHAYPSHFHPESRTCATCGCDVPFDPRKL